MVQSLEPLEMKAQLLAEAIARMHNEDTAKKLGSGHYWTVQQVIRALRRGEHDGSYDAVFLAHPSDSSARTEMIKLAEDLQQVSLAFLDAISVKADVDGQNVQYTALEGAEALYGLLRAQEGKSALTALLQIPHLLRETEKKAVPILEYDDSAEHRQTTAAAYETLMPHVKGLARLVEQVPEKPLLDEVHDKIYTAWEKASYSFARFIQEFDELEADAIDSHWQGLLEKNKVWVQGVYDIMKHIHDTDPQFLKRELQQIVPMTYDQDGMGVRTHKESRAEILSQAHSVLRMACACMYEQYPNKGDAAFEEMKDHMREIYEAIGSIETAVTILAGKTALQSGVERAD